MKLVNLSALVCAFFAVLGSAAQAQTLGNYANLDGNFRYDLRIGPVFQQQLDFDTLENADVIIEPNVLLTTYPGIYTNVTAFTAFFDFRGLEIVGSYAANSTTFRVQIASVPGSDCDNAALGIGLNQPCTFDYFGPSRDIAYADFQDDLEDLDDPRIAALFMRALAKSSPIDPLAGNPDSIQGSLVRRSLDLSAPDVALYRDTLGADEPWLIGLAYNNASSGRFEGDHWTGRAQRSFRLFEGNRGRLKIDLPFNVSVYNDAIKADLVGSVGYEFVAINDRWTLEPRVSYGGVFSEDLFSAGQMMSASLSSRYRFDGVGRGHFILGNMVGYTKTLPTAGVDPDITNTVFRNGLAYELPMKMQMGGRAMSLRGSYTHTNFAGDDLYMNAYDEVALSFGVRNRGLDAKNSFEIFRFGLNGTFAGDYSAYGLSLGARF
ncbi:hypothetical protein BH11PSE2_BH11PSE2_15670 [soil metagenome]